jgi:hypothetical protein
MSFLHPQHIFHRACIEPWLQRNNTCPICRTKIEWHRNMDAAEELMHHNIENGQAIINALAARILDTVSNSGLVLKEDVENSV